MNTPCVTPEVLRCARYLRAVIPAPARKRPKATKSWRLLKPGQYLRNKNKLVLGGVTLEPGELWSVAGVNSQGATLRNEAGAELPLSQPEWKNEFDRARKPKEQ